MIPSVGTFFKKLLLAVIGESTIWTPLRFIIRNSPGSHWQLEEMPYQLDLFMNEVTFVYVARKVCVYSVWDFIYYYNVLGVKG